MSDNQDTIVYNVPAELRFAGAEPAAATARLAERTPHWRTMAAARELAIWWGLALVTLFIPLLHFFAVPGFLLFGAWRAYRRLNEKRTLLALHGICPHCGKDQEFPAGDRLRDSRTVTCAHCKWELKLEVSPAAGDADTGRMAAANE